MTCKTREIHPRYQIQYSLSGQDASKTEERIKSIAKTVTDGRPYTILGCCALYDMAIATNDRKTAEDIYYRTKDIVISQLVHLLGTTMPTDKSVETRN